MQGFWIIVHFLQDSLTHVGRTTPDIFSADEQLIWIMMLCVLFTIPIIVPAALPTGPTDLYFLDLGAYRHKEDEPEIDGNVEANHATNDPAHQVLGLFVEN